MIIVFFSNTNDLQLSFRFIACRKRWKIPGFLRQGARRKCISVSRARKNNIKKKVHQKCELTSAISISSDETDEVHLWSDGTESANNSGWIQWKHLTPLPHHKASISVHLAKQELMANLSKTFPLSLQEINTLHDNSMHWYSILHWRMQPNLQIKAYVEEHTQLDKARLYPFPETEPMKNRKILPNTQIVFPQR